jgi:urease accessory protein
MKTPATAALFALIATPALAHAGAGAAEGLVRGLMHPLLGLDHLLAMLAVGLWSGVVLPRRVWAGAAVFVAAMALGAGAARAGLGPTGVEAGILASVLVLGALVLSARRGQAPALTAATLAAIGVFAAAHGHAHATEASGPAAAYLAGVLATTAAVHGAGIALARAVARWQRGPAALGAGITLAGLWLALG